MIPTARAFGLALVAPAIILVYRGVGWSIALAWVTLAVLAVSTLLDGWFALRHRLVFQRQAPGQLHVDQPQRIEWSVENRAAVPAKIWLRDQTPAGVRGATRELAVTVAGRSRATMAYDCLPSRRGDGAFGDAVYRVLGPLGLAWSQRHLEAAWPVRVLPHLANWKAAQLVERRALARQTGSHRHRWHGAGTIFESLREYSAEDDIRWVDWKATARRQRPISRNYQVERHQQILLLVDASRMMTTYCGQRTKFDTVLEAAVLATRVVVNQGDAAGLLLFSDRIEAYVHPRRDSSQLRTVMGVLYPCYPRLVEPDFEAALTLTATRLRRRSLIVLFTDVTATESANRMAAYLSRLAPRHLPLVVTIADEVVERLELTEPRSGNDMYRVAVASQLMVERAELLERLRARGIETLDSPADQIATQTIDCYFKLKRRMRL